MTDREYMLRAYVLALKGKGRTSPNPMVGAVVVKGGRVIAEGWHQRCGGPHAEAIALKRAGAAARGATLYVTFEPCAHVGRTPPCVEQVIASGVKRVVVGMRDPNPLTNGRSLRRMRTSGIKVDVGLMSVELEKLNEVFIKYITRRMPFVTAKTAQTLDGKIATRSGESKWITSAASRTWARARRNDFDAILVGVGTVLSDDPRLEPSPRNKELKKVVLDSRLRVPLNARLFRGTVPGQCVIVTTPKAPQAKIALLERRGVIVLVAPAKKGRVDLGWTMRQLAEGEVSSVLIEGGGEVVGSALRERFVDRMMVFIAPKFMGDEKALSSVRGLPVRELSQCVRLSNPAIRLVDEDWVIEGDVQYPKPRGE